MIKILCHVIFVHFLKFYSLAQMEGASLQKNGTTPGQWEFLCIFKFLTSTGDIVHYNIQLKSEFRMRTYTRFGY